MKYRLWLHVEAERDDETREEAALPMQAGEADTLSEALEMADRLLGGEEFEDFMWQDMPPEGDEDGVTEEQLEEQLDARISLRHTVPRAG